MIAGELLTWVQIVTLIFTPIAALYSFLRASRSRHIVMMLSNENTVRKFETFVGAVEFLCCIEKSFKGYRVDNEGIVKSLRRNKVELVIATGYIKNKIDKTRYLNNTYFSFANRDKTVKGEGRSNSEMPADEKDEDEKSIPNVEKLPDGDVTPDTVFDKENEKKVALINKFILDTAYELVTIKGNAWFSALFGPAKDSKYRIDSYIIELHAHIEGASERQKNKNHFDDKDVEAKKKGAVNSDVKSMNSNLEGKVSSNNEEMIINSKEQGSSDANDSYSNYTGSNGQPEIAYELNEELRRFMKGKWGYRVCDFIKGDWPKTISKKIDECIKPKKVEGEKTNQ